MVARALHLVRHGEVQNPAGVVYERLPEFGLSDRGREMAALAAGWLADRPVGRLIASPLLRTQQSAEPIAAAFGLRVEPDDRVIEGTNRFAGVNVREEVRRRPWLVWRFRNPLRPSWGEPFPVVRDRMRQAVLEALRDGDDEHDVVIVSHQLPIWLVHRSVEGAPLAHDPRRRRCALSSVTSFAIRDGRGRRARVRRPGRAAGRRRPGRDVRRLRVVAPALVALLLLTGCTEQGAQGGSSGPGYIAGDGTISQWPKPTTDPVTFSGTTVDGGTFSSKRYLGRIVVVNFWYAGCPPCRAEAPALNALADRFKDDGVQFVGVNVTDDAATAASFERTYRSTYPSIVDQAGGASVQLAFAASRPPKAVPSTLVLDRQGRVTSRVVGLANESNLKTLIQDAIDGDTA